MTEFVPLVTAALAELRASHVAQQRAIDSLEMALQQALKDSVKCLSPSEALPTEHRRLHRPGVASKVASDPELQAFIMARIDRLSFTALAAEVAANFPPGRRVSHSAIHRWWSKQNVGRQHAAPCS